jgi:hypothetical protein
MSRQSLVFATNRGFDDPFRLLGPIVGTAPVADANGDFDAAENIALVGPLVEGDLSGGSEELAALAKIARAAVATTGHAAVPKIHHPREPSLAFAPLM